MKQHLPSSLGFSSLLFLIVASFSFSQTTYTWIGASGGSWAVSTNWSPNRVTPAASDILQFNSGTVITVTAVTTPQTIRQLIVTNNTDVSLQSSASGTLTLGSAASTNVLTVDLGSTLQISSAGAISLTIAFPALATLSTAIAGSIMINANTGLTNAINFMNLLAANNIITGTITNNGGNITSTAATITFGAGSFYNHARNGGSIPTATYNATSTVNITGITSTNPSPFTGTYGNLIWNCASQTSTGAISGAITVNGNLQIIAGTLFLNGFTITANSNITNDGTINSSAVNSRITMNGTIAQTISGTGTWTTGTTGRLLNLTVNNTSGLNPAVNLDVNVALQTSLVLTTGILGGTGTLTIGVPATAITTTRTAGSLANVPNFNFTTGAYAITYNGSAAINTGNEIPPSTTPTNGILTVNIANTNVTLMADANIGSLTTSLASNTFNVNGFTIGMSLTPAMSNTGTLTANAAASTLKFNGTVAQTFTLAGTYTGSIISNIIIDNTNVATGVSFGTNNINVRNLTTNPSRILTLAGQNINVSENLQNDGTINSSAVNSRITMNGTIAQTISGAGTWTTGTIGRLLNLTINNTSGLNPAVNLDVNVAVQTSLNLTAGILGGTGTLTMGIGAASTLTMTRISGALAITPVFNLTGVTFNAVYGNGVAVPLITTGAEIPYSPSTFSNFTVNNPTNGVALSSSIIMSGSPGLTLTNGYLFIGNYNVTLTSTAAGAISGGSATTFVVADATGGNIGQLIRATSGTLTYNFPVGDATGTTEYSPVSLAFSVNGTARNIGVNVTDAQHPNDGTATDFISRYWTFSDNNAGVGTYTYTPTFTFLNPADLTGTYANLFLDRWDGSGWTQFTNSGASPNLSAASLTETTGTLGGNDFTGRVNIATYTWNQTGTASWATAGNWTPARNVPSITDVLLFNNGATTVATNVPTQTIRQLLVSANTNVSLQSSAAVTLSIRGPTLTNNLQIEAGSTLQLSSAAANSINITIITTASQRADISGSFILNTNTSNNNTFTTTAVGTTVVTVASGGSIVNNGGVVTASAATLVFSAGATYSHTMNSGTIPTATWINSSPFPTVEITSSTTGPTAGLNQTFGNFTLNTGAAVTTTLTGATQINGMLTLTNGIFSVGANTLTLNGDLSIGSGSMRGGTTSNLSITGTATALTLPAITNNLQNLIINRANGVVLGAPLSLSTTGVLTLTSGNLTTTSTNILTVNNTAAGGVSGGSSSSYVNGPLARAFPASLVTGSTYTFPVGKTVYNLFELVNPTTNAAGTVTAEVFDANSGGTAGFGLSALNTNRYWQATTSSSFMTSSTVRLTEPSLGGANRVGQSATLSGTYVARGGNAPSPVLSGAVDPALNYFVLSTSAGAITLSGTYPVGNSSAFLKLADVANALNSYTVTGDVIFELQTDYDGTVGEIFPIIFNQYSSASYTATIRPATGVSMRTTSGTTSSLGMITLSGIDKITFDGRAGGSGSASAWTIQNTTSGSAYPVFDFIDGASNDVLQYLTVLGSGSNATGNILFSTSTVAGGNSNNIIQYCSIGNYSAQPYAAILSNGTAGANANSGNSILNNNIYNFQSFNNYSDANVLNGGIVVSSTGNGSNWTINNNSFYADVITTGRTLFVIYFRPGSSSTGNVISGNYIGGQAPQCGTQGTYWRFNGIPVSWNGWFFEAISVNSGGVTVSNNTISNIKMNSTVQSQHFVGIYVVGGPATVSGNLIGHGTSCYSIYGANAGQLFGILNMSSSAVTISNNTIANGTSNFDGSPSSFNQSGVCGISSNLPGGVNSPNTISNNTIYNLSNEDNYNSSYVISGWNFGTGGGAWYGPMGDINCKGGSANSQFGGQNIMIVGIYLQQANANGNHTISNNTIYGLNNLVTGGTWTSYIIGIFDNVYGNLSTRQININANTIYGLYAPDNYGVAGTDYMGLIGIFVAPNQLGTHNITNNMVQLGYKTDGTSVRNSSIRGIWDNSDWNNNNLGINFYFNNVYIGGTETTCMNSYAFNRSLIYSSAVYDLLNVRNNIFVNQRSGATSNHYGIFLNDKVSVAACNYNDVYGTGSGYVFGNHLGTDYATLAAWQTGTGTLDANSIASDPLYVSPATISPDLHILTGSPAINAGTNIAGYTDFEAQARSNPPDIGADEYSAGYISPSYSLSGCGGQVGLPIELLVFDGALKNGKAFLHWETASEINNDYFTLERAKSGVVEEWNVVGKVKGAGNSSTVQSYSFVDDSPFTDERNEKGLVYYRLKQTDYDGRFEYSNIIALKKNNSESGIVIYPNPNGGVFTIKNEKLKIKSIEIYNVLGEKVFEMENRRWKMENGNTLTIDIADEPQGIYTVFISAEEKTFTKKIIIY